MYQILVVDDEKIERDGIKHLIKMFNLPLEIAEAENGESALEYLKTTVVDILFTDIKMPFMNGLDLAQQAKLLHPHLKTIIFSAFGEFDYAQRAIKSSVVSYILKPIDVEEFSQLMDRVIQMCRDDAEEEEELARIQSGYLRGLEYEKSRLLHDLISGIEMDQAFTVRMETAEIDLSEGYVLLMLMDMNERFFDTHHEEFEVQLAELIPYEYEYLNINEKQSLIWLKKLAAAPTREQLISFGQQMINAMDEKYGLKPLLIIGNSLKDLTKINLEYELIESLLDKKFFYDYGSVLFTYDEEMGYSASTKTNDLFLKDIFTAISSGDTLYAVENIERLFEYFRVNAQMSPIYVKFICADILKKVYEKVGKTDRADFIVELETIFTNSNVTQLKDELIRIVTAQGESKVEIHEDTQKSVISKVIEIIKKEYKQDISLEYIADKVYLTPSYLSYLFKKEVNQSLVKYMTSYRIKKAKELLQTTNMKIIDISEAVGYANLSYFGLIFKNNVGLSPAKFREAGEAE